GRERQDQKVNRPQDTFPHRSYIRSNRRCCADMLRIPRRIVNLGGHFDRRTLDDAWARLSAKSFTGEHKMTTPRARYSVVAMKDRRNIFVSYSHKDAKDVQTILAQIPQRC